MWICDGVMRVHCSTVMELMEKKQSGATWKPWGEFGIIVLLLFCFVPCVCFSLPCIVCIKIFPWMLPLLLFSPPVRYQYCAGKAAVKIVMPWKIYVRSFRSLHCCHFFIACIEVRSFGNRRCFFRPLLTTSFNHSVWNFPGIVFFMLSTLPSAHISQNKIKEENLTVPWTFYPSLKSN